MLKIRYPLLLYFVSSLHATSILIYVRYSGRRRCMQRLYKGSATTLGGKKRRAGLSFQLTSSIWAGSPLLPPILLTKRPCHPESDNHDFQALICDFIGCRMRDPRGYMGSGKILVVITAEFDLRTRNKEF
jgi:hypothetical protein